MFVQRTNICATDLSTISGFIAWIIVFITYLRFRKAIIYNGMLSVLPYRTPLQPYATWVCLVILCILTLTNGFNVFFPGQWSVSDFLAAYITLPIFIALYLGHKIYFAAFYNPKHNTTEKSSSKVKQFYGGWIFATPIKDIDVLTGKQEMDALEAMDSPPVPRNVLEKIWFWIA